ncbi:MAG: hypothetical protein K5776_07875 [Lachnospiraceae bacterium]|nr:hypothetical protein [Lachnospiraceae bacterium]
MMTIKESIKLYDYVYKKNTQILIIIMQFFMFFGYAFTNNLQTIGIVLLNTVLATIATQFALVTFSSYVVSSEKIQKYGIRNLTIIMTAANVVFFAIYLGLKLLKGFALKDFDDLSTMLFIYCIANILMFVYGAIGCKKRAAGTVILILHVIIGLSQMPFYIRGTVLKIISRMPGAEPYTESRFVFTFLPNPVVMIIISVLVVSVISPLLLYALSMSVRKVSYSNRLLDRQEYNKL